MNSVNLVGNLGRDPEVRYAASGTAVCTFSVAIDERRRADEKATWISVVCFGETAKWAGRDLKKGNKVSVSGRIQVRDWEDRDGNKRTAYDIVAHEVRGIIWGRNERQEPKDRPRASEDYGPPPGDAEIPF